MKGKNLLWLLIFGFAAWFVWVHYVRGVPVKRK